MVVWYLALSVDILGLSWTSVLISQNLWACSDTMSGTKFLAYLGGNVAAGYAIVKYVAAFLLLGDDEVKRKMSLAGGSSSSGAMSTSNPLQSSV